MADNPIRLLLALLAAVALTAAPYSTLMPAIVHEAFGGNARRSAFSSGAGGIRCRDRNARVVAAQKRAPAAVVPVLFGAALMAGAALIALSLWTLPLSIMLMAVVDGRWSGFGILVISVSVNVILQAVVNAAGGRSVAG